MKLVHTIAAVVVAAGAGYVAQPAIHSVTGSKASDTSPAGQQYGWGQQGGRGQGGGMRGMRGPLAGIKVDESKLTCIAAAKDAAASPAPAAGAAAPQGAGANMRGAMLVRRELGCRTLKELGITPTPGQPPLQQIRAKGVDRSAVQEAAKNAMKSMVDDGIITQDQADQLTQLAQRMRQMGSNRMGGGQGRPGMMGGGQGMGGGGPQGGQPMGGGQGMGGQQGGRQVPADGQGGEGVPQGDVLTY